MQRSQNSVYSISQLINSQYFR